MPHESGAQLRDVPLRISAQLDRLEGRLERIEGCIERKGAQSSQTT